MLCYLLCTMASIHKSFGRECWYCAFTTPDGIRRFKSTKTTDRKAALQICNAWERASRESRLGKLTPERAREIISSGVADVYSAGAKEELPSSSLKSWVAQWLEAKSIELTPSSLSRYERVMNSFIDSLGVKATKDMATIQPREISKWRDQVAKSLTVSSANLSLKCLRVCFNDALKHQLITSNPAGIVKTLKRVAENRRREMTLEEIKRVLSACDHEWRGIVLFGLYSGQRLGDIRSLTWRSVDMQKWDLKLVTGKTGRRMVIPIVKPLQDYLLSLPSEDDPQAPLFPKAFSAKRVGALSNQFREILVEAGLATPRTHQKVKQGRAFKREVSELSFHSLRHSAVTFLKASGASDVMAREIVGHDSEAVSRKYTHLSSDDIRKAIGKMPNL